MKLPFGPHRHWHLYDDMAGESVSEGGCDGGGGEWMETKFLLKYSEWLLCLFLYTVRFME